MDQGIDGGGSERVAANQQRVKRESLAQLIILNKARHLAVDAAPRLQTRQLRGGTQHIAKRQKGNGAELKIAFGEHRARVIEKALIACYVARIEFTDLRLQPRLIVVIAKHLARLPAEPVERRDRQQLNVVTHRFARQREQLLDSAGVGNNRWASIKGKALILINISAAARLVALLQQSRWNACRLQANRQRQSAKSCANYRGLLHRNVLRPEG